MFPCGDSVVLTTVLKYYWVTRICEGVTSLLTSCRNIADKLYYRKVYSLLFYLSCFLTSTLRCSTVVRVSFFHEFRMGAIVKAAVQSVFQFGCTVESFYRIQPVQNGAVRLTQLLPTETRSNIMLSSNINFSQILERISFKLALVFVKNFLLADKLCRIFACLVDSIQSSVYTFYRRLFSVRVRF
jgi:hypothetical protein